MGHPQFLDGINEKRECGVVLSHPFHDEAVERMGHPQFLDGSRMGHPAYLVGVVSMPMVWSQVSTAVGQVVTGNLVRRRP